jgi:flagellar biosynthesis/type III secretory pathway M-ring protein FliF/YscJ
MLTWLRNAWAWLVAALGGALLVVGLLWQRAVRQRDEARAERDAARRSAEREREVVVESEAVREAVRGRRVAIEETRRERVEEIEARPKPTTRDELAAELNRRMEARRGR